MARTRATKPKPVEEIEFRVVWEHEDSLPVLYSNQLIISHSGGSEFYLLFGHLSPPLPPNLTAEGKKSEFVSVKPIARIVVSPSAMENFIEAMSRNIEKFKEQEK